MYGSPIVRMSVWPSTGDEVLAEDVLERSLVHGLDLAGVHRGHAVGRLPRLEDLAAGLRRHAVEPVFMPEERGPVAGRPLPLPLLEHRHRAVRPNVSLLSVVSIWKIFTPASRRTSPMRQFEWCSSEWCRSMNDSAVLHRLDVVVVAQAAVAGQAGGGRLPAAVHGDEVDVHVDEQVALGRPLVDLDLLALVGRAEEGEVVGVLGVVVVQQAVRGEGVVDPVADGVAQLGLGHAPVQGEGGDEVDVVDARPRRPGRAPPRSPAGGCRGAASAAAAARRRRSRS